MVDWFSVSVSTGPSIRSLGRASSSIASGGPANVTFSDSGVLVWTSAHGRAPPLALTATRSGAAKLREPSPASCSSKLNVASAISSGHCGCVPSGKPLPKECHRRPSTCQGSTAPVVLAGCDVTAGGVDAGVDLRRLFPAGLAGLVDSAVAGTAAGEPAVAGDDAAGDD